MKYLLIAMACTCLGSIKAETIADNESAKAFVSQAIVSLANGGHKLPFQVADNIIALDSGETIAAAQFKQAWPEFAKMTFTKTLTGEQAVKLLHIHTALVTDKQKLLSNKRLMKAYKPEPGDVYCEASAADEKNEAIIAYKKALIYVIRKKEGQWVLVGIGG